MSEIKFEESWFFGCHKRGKSCTREIWERRLLPVKDEVNSYLELGVCEGHSLKWVVENLEPRFACGVDPWIAPRVAQKKAFAKYKENAYENLRDHLEPQGRVRLHEMTSLQFLGGQFAFGEATARFDLIFIDGDHRGPEALLDILLSFFLLTPKGRIVIDDLQRSWHRNRPLVYWSFIFAEQILKDRVTREWMDGRQVCLRRLKTRGDERS